METKVTMTNWEKVEKVLQEVKRTMGKKTIVRKDYGDDLQFFQGKIGNAVTFTGESLRNRQSTTIELSCEKQRLGTIRLCSNFPTKANTDILVISPQWSTAKPISTVTKEQGRALKIWYTPKEDPNVVIDNLYQAVERNRVQVAKKLRQFNLPKLKLCEAVKSLASKICGTVENRPQTANNHDCEM